MQKHLQDSPQELQHLYTTLAQISSVDAMEDFLQDLCTPNELSAFADRWRVAKLLHNGLTQRDVAMQTNVSIATVTRVARFLHQGFGGYRAQLTKK